MGQWALRCLIFIHRWLGVCLCPIVLLWFFSGTVMMYWSYPDVTRWDRLQRAPTIIPESIRISAEEAQTIVGKGVRPNELLITSFDGRPVYRFRAADGRGSPGQTPAASSWIVYADDGTERRFIDEPMMDRAASRWSGRTIGEAHKVAVDEPDQWTVGSLRNLRPLLKYTWPDGQQVYVSGRTAEVVQYTTTASRFWAYLGAIPHWLYFTPLRRHQQQWFSVVVLASLMGTIAALVGVVIALCMYSPTKRFRYAGVPTSLPYQGWKRWHTIAGLVFGAVTTTWAFSGLLSMGPFSIVNRLADLTIGVVERGEPHRLDLEEVLRGRDGIHLSAYAAKPSQMAIAQLSGFDVKEVEYASFDGKPFYLAVNGRGETRVVPVDGDPMLAFNPSDIIRALQRAEGERVAELRVMDEYDAYYLDRRRKLPLPIVYLRLNDSIASRYYIDPRTAQVVRSYSARNWIDRWLYHGLHSLDLPWLYKHRPLWDVTVIALMLGGAALSLTSVVLAWRVLARALKSVAQKV